MKNIFILIFFSVVLVCKSFSQNLYQPNWQSIDSRPVPQWFQDAKFGIFIHWGVYSVPSYIYINRSGSVYDCYAEWYEVLAMSRKGQSRDFHDRVFGKNFEYRQFANLFKAELWEPDKWASLFKEAGAKYVILTSKHHDGFALWPASSPYSKNWNSGDVGPKRDLVGDLSKSVTASGLKMGLYFSLIEWETSKTNREGNFYGRYLPRAITSKYEIPADKMISEHILPQMKELVMNYKPSILFTDGDWDEDYKQLKSLDFLSWLYNNAPNKDEVVVNDRWGQVRGLHGGYFTREYADITSVGEEHPWEEIQGMGYSFGYNRNEDIKDYRTSEELIHLLVNTVGRGGNLCLNVGPAADGRIPVIMQQRLCDIGAWLKLNGEGIYGTRVWVNPNEKKHDKQLQFGLTKEKSAIEAASVKTNRKIFFTKKGKDIFILTTEWPTHGIQISGLNLYHGTKILLLGNNKPAKWKFSQGNLTIMPPVIMASELLNKSAYVFKIFGAILK